MNVEHMQCQEIQEVSVLQREDRFQSRYFDRQIAYKHLFRLSDGYTIESGAYQHFRGASPISLAIDMSTMIGCPMNCKFCASGSMPYVRSLTVNEIVSQVIRLIDEHDTHAFPKIVCSFQGIGEPALIPDKIVEVSKHLLKVDERIAISISTTGINQNAFRVWRDSKIPIDNLQISCSGTTSDQVGWLTPGLPAFDILLTEAITCAKSPNFKKVKFNYILIQGFNDSDQDVRRLVSCFKQTQLIVKISALNWTSVSKRHRLMPSSLKRAQEVCDELQSNGIDSYVYGSFNSTDVSCGQLTFTNRNGLL